MAQQVAIKCLLQTRGLGVDAVNLYNNLMEGGETQKLQGSHLILSIGRNKEGHMVRPKYRHAETEIREFGFAEGTPWILDGFPDPVSP